MKKRNRGILSLLLSLALLVALAGGYVPKNSAGAADAGTTAAGTFENLNQSEIVQAMGAGWNLGNQLEANIGGTPKEDAWTEVEISERLIRNVKSNGFNSIRIPISWLSKIGEGPDYAIDEAWISRVQQVVDWAIQYKLYVIINIHGDGYSSVQGGWLLPDAEDQDTIKEKYQAVWRQIAERFKDYDHHLIYESMNEVGANIAEMKDGTAKDAAIRAAYENINAYNQIFVDTVRQTGGNNDKRWLLIPGLNTNIGYTVGDYGFQIPTDTYRSADIPEGEKRLMVSVHYYTPWEFCGLENYKQTQWGDDADPSKSVGYGGESDMEEQFASLKEKFTSQGYPVVIGEYGSIDKSKKKDSGQAAVGVADPENTQFRAFYAWRLCQFAIQNGCIPVYWDNGWNGDFGFAIFSRGNAKDKELGYRTAGSVTQPEILNAIVGCYGAEKGKATAITLNKNNLSLELTDSPETLEATLTPADAGDTITWESSDPKVASVNYKGKVSPTGAGTCLITATVPNGPSAYCVVKVTEPSSFKAGLYAMASSWATLECGDNDYVTISKNGTDRYTMTLSGDGSLFKPIRTLYIKDVTVHRGVATESILKSANFVIKSIRFNTTDIPLAQTQYYYDKEFSKGVADITILNVWYDAINCMNLDYVVSETSDTDIGYNFPEDSYVSGTNTLSIDFEIQDAVLDLKENQAETAATAIDVPEGLAVRPGNTAAISAAIQPENATEKVLWFSENSRIASVDQSGTVTGVAEGETSIHVLTASGIDKVCKVSVSEDVPLEQETPPPSGDGSTTTQEPSTKPSAEPSTKPSAEPSTKPSAEPSTKPSAGPSTKPSADPGVKPSANPNDPIGNQNKTLAKGTIFTAGKFKYKVTNAAAGKTAVAVKAPKSKKAKSLAIPAKVKKNGISYSVSSVGASAFKNCKKLKKITIGKNVVSIGKNAFSGAKALKMITVKSTKLKKVGKNALKGIHKKAVIKVPKKKLKRYRKLWKKKGQKKSVKIK